MMASRPEKKATKQKSKRGKSGKSRQSQMTSHLASSTTPAEQIGTVDDFPSETRSHILENGKSPSKSSKRTKSPSDIDVSETAGETIGQLKDTLAAQLASMMDVIGSRAEQPGLVTDDPTLRDKENEEGAKESDQGSSAVQFD